MVSKMSARPDPPVSPARWENSDQTPSGNTCCYLEDTKLTCADRFMSRQWKLDGTIKYIDCNQEVPRRRIFATIFFIGISTEERLQKTLYKDIFDDTPNHQFQSNRFWCFLEFGCTFPRTVVLLNVARFSVFLHKLAALLLLPYEYVPRPAPGVSRLERPDGRR